jgi:hypothetical protein
MWVRRSWMTLVAVLVVGLLAAAPVSAAKPGSGGDTSTAEPVPASMASLGDSITRAFNACGFFFDCTGRSWSTGGSSDAVNSHFERLRALDSTMSTAHNDARSGAKMGELPTQAQTAVNQGVGYVTILMGANDACTSDESTMTSVDSFRASFQSAMATLDPDARGVKVFVATIPDVYRLWEVGHTSSSARTAWSSYGICQSLLKNPTSTDPADEARRQRVRQRVMDFNAAMQAGCAVYVNCRDDGGAVFGYPFLLSQLSGWDYFHPNESGQAVLAEETFAAGFEWAAAKKGGGRK